MPDPKEFLAGVIEGFYGEPWTNAERFELFEWMSAWRLNTYLYAPKDDLKQRALWREVYSSGEAGNLREVIRACQMRKILFIYALSPGLDICYSSEDDRENLKKRFEQMIELGCEHFALLFDDIPDGMGARDAERFPSFAAAQCDVANALFQWTRERSPDTRFLFCPTPYCGRMASHSLGGEGYLSTLGRMLRPEIDVFWTGPEIISREIKVEGLRALQTILGRKPLIWDNLHANDYDGRRFFCGPYAGRPPELRKWVSGLMVNPNNEFPLNFVPLRTLGQFVRADDTWDDRKAYLSAMREWLPRFATAGKAAMLEDLVFLGDCYYLPHQEGAEAEKFYTGAEKLIAEDPTKWGQDLASFRQRAGRLREFCVRITELRNRPLFYALSRRVWELREELDLWERYVEFRLANGDPNIPFRSDGHLPGTYRGGIVPRLQRLLSQKSDGAFTAEVIADAASAKEGRPLSTP